MSYIARADRSIPSDENLSILKGRTPEPQQEEETSNNNNNNNNIMTNPILKKTGAPGYTSKQKQIHAHQQYEKSVKIGVARTIEVKDDLPQSIREQLANIEEKSRNAHYVPVDSFGGAVRDDGTDFLYRYQSNKHSIHDALNEKESEDVDTAKKKVKKKNTKQVIVDGRLVTVDVSDSEDEDGKHDGSDTNSSRSSDGEGIVERLRKELAQKSNTGQINKLRILTQQRKLKGLLSLLHALEHSAGLDGGDAELNAFEGDDELVLDGENAVEQLEAAKSMLGVKSQQCSALVQIVRDIRSKLRRRSMAGRLSSSFNEPNLVEENRLLKREREFLYYKVYGAQAALLLEKPPARVSEDSLEYSRKSAAEELAEVEAEEARKKEIERQFQLKLEAKKRKRFPGRIAANPSRTSSMSSSPLLSPKQRMHLKLETMERSLLEYHDIAQQTYHIERREGSSNGAIKTHQEQVLFSLNKRVQQALEEWGGEDCARDVRYITEGHSTILAKALQAAYRGVSRVFVAVHPHVALDIVEVLDGVSEEFELLSDRIVELVPELMGMINSAAAKDFTEEGVGSQLAGSSADENNYNSAVENVTVEQEQVPAPPVFDDAAVQCTLIDPGDDLPSVSPRTPTPKSAPKLLVETTSTEIQTLPVQFHNSRTKVHSVAVQSEPYKQIADAVAPTGTVTFAFVDVQSSAKLWEHVPDAMACASTTYWDVVNEAIATHSGYLVRAEGESCLVAFAEARDAMLFALMVQSKLMTLDYPQILYDFPDTRKEYDNDGVLIWNGLRVRIGMHTGEAIEQSDLITHRKDYFGTAVILAARIASRARGGQILISNSVHGGMKEHVKLLNYPMVTNLGPVSLRADGPKTSADMCILYNVLPQALASRKFVVRNPEEQLLPSLRGAVLGRWLPNLETRTKSIVFSDAQEQAPIDDPVVVMVGVDNIERALEVLDRGNAKHKFMSDIHGTWRRVLQCHRGYEVKLSQWSLFATFFDVLSALRFAADLQTTMLHFDYPDIVLSAPGMGQIPEKPTENDPIRWRGLRTRIGIHVGACETRIETSSYKLEYSGPTVNRSARMCLAARGGQTYVSNEVVETLEDDAGLDGIALVNIGIKMVRGIKNPMRLHVLYPAPLVERHEDYEAAEQEEVPAVRAFDRCARWGCDALRNSCTGTLGFKNTFQTRAPQGDVVLVSVDVFGSAMLWEECEGAMHIAVSQLCRAVKDTLGDAKGYLVRTDGDTFVIAFTAMSHAVRWCLDLQRRALGFTYPPELLKIEVASEGVDDSKGQAQVVWKGLRLRMALGRGAPHCEVDGGTFRMKYSGHFVQRLNSTLALTCGGELLFSDDELQAVHRFAESDVEMFMYDLGPQTLPGMDADDDDALQKRLFGLLPAELGARRIDIDSQRKKLIAALARERHAGAHKGLTSRQHASSWSHQHYGSQGDNAAPSTFDAYFEDPREIEKEALAELAGGKYCVGIPRDAVRCTRRLHPDVTRAVMRVCAIRKYPPELTEGECDDALADLEFGETTSIGASHITDVDGSLTHTLLHVEKMVQYILWLTRDVKDKLVAATHNDAQTLLTVAPHSSGHVLANMIGTAYIDVGGANGVSSGSGGGGRLTSGGGGARFQRPPVVPTTTNMLLGEIKQLQTQLVVTQERHDEEGRERQKRIAQRKQQRSAQQNSRQDRQSNSAPTFGGGGDLDDVDFSVQASTGFMGTSRPPTSSGVLLGPLRAVPEHEEGLGVQRQRLVGAPPTSASSSRRTCTLSPLMTQYETTADPAFEMKGVDASNNIETRTGPFSVLSRPPSSQQQGQGQLIATAPAQRPNTSQGTSVTLASLLAPPTESPVSAAPGTVLYYAQRRQVARASSGAPVRSTSSAVTTSSPSNKSAKKLPMQPIPSTRKPLSSSASVQSKVRRKMSLPTTPSSAGGASSTDP
eukprot:PhM_4_TR6242/c0_g1_i1/m.86688